ncbi:MAG: hypothetical protein JO222_14415, partial [Frankiales bacterium]|nr:hypothetical protein [Frankiales bacterium]
MAHAQPPPHRAVRPAAALLVWALIAVGVIAPLAIYRLDRHRDHPGSSSGHRHGHLPAAGQHTRSDVLPLSVRSFSTGAAGWVGAQSGWQRTLGRSGAGALTLGAAGAAGHLGKVESPAFSVTPGARYVATAWARAAQGTSALA